MRRILVRIGVVLTAITLLLLAGGYALPREVRVERSTLLPRPPCTVFAVVEGFERFNDWSPWHVMDPGATYTYDGPARGVGAKMAWATSNGQVGKGSQTITALSPCTSVDVDLYFEGEGHSRVGYLLAPADGGTTFTWWMVSDLGNNPIMRYVGLAMDAMLGAQFEQGLASLVKLTEGLPTADFGGVPIEQLDVAPILLAQLTTTSAKDPMAVGAALGAGYAQIQAAIAPLGLTIGGAPRAIYRPEGPGFAIDAALPVVGTPTAELPVDSPVKLVPGYAGPAVRAVHRGPYATLTETIEKVDAYVTVLALPRAADAPSWEEYLSDPATTPEADLQTAIVVPLATPPR